MAEKSNGNAKAQEPEAPKPATSVKYIGSSDRRIISLQSWQKAGVQGQDDTVWEPANRFLVKADQLNDDAIALLDELKDFRVNR